MGGGALFFAKQPSEAEIINDLNGNVTNFYRVAKTNFEALRKMVEGTLHSRNIYREAQGIYDRPKKHNPVTRAWAFWVLTNQGFSGRIGSWGLGKDNKVGKTLASKRERFTGEYAERLKFVQIESKDAIAIIKQYDSVDTFFYLDPPYFNSDCGHYKGYSEEDFKNLLDVLVTIKGKFLLSNYPSPILQRYIKKHKWNFREKHQQVSVSHLSRKAKIEQMVFNYPLEKKEAMHNPVETSKHRRDKKVSYKDTKGYHKDIYSAPKNLHIQKEGSCFGANLYAYDPMQTKEKTEILKRIYQSLSNGIRSGKSEIARDWLKSKGLSIESSGAGFCSGQLQHRKPKEYIKELESVGFLKANNHLSKSGDTGYISFAKYGIVFPLRDISGDIVSFYGIRIQLEQEEHSFMNDEGIYPAFPHEMTTQLYITTNVLDAATLMESRLLDNREAVICIPQGKVLKQHEEAIARLKQLKNIFWIESSEIKLTAPLKGKINPVFSPKTKTHA